MRGILNAEGICAFASAGGAAICSTVEPLTAVRTDVSIRRVAAARLARPEATMDCTLLMEPGSSGSPFLFACGKSRNLSLIFTDRPLWFPCLMSRNENLSNSRFRLRAHQRQRNGLVF